MGTSSNARDRRGVKSAFASNKLFVVVDEVVDAVVDESAVDKVDEVDEVCSPISARCLSNSILCQVLLSLL